MAEVVRVASVPMPPCALAAGSHGGFPFLAAGPAAGNVNWSATDGHDLRVFPTGSLQTAVVNTFRSPAAFCSLSWANPTGETCSSSSFPSGLIAGGLENGVVAIWDPRSKLGDLESGSSSSIIPNYVAPELSLPFHGFTANMVDVSSDSGTTSHNDAAKMPVQGLESQYLEVDEGEFQIKLYSSWATCKMNQNHFLPADLQELPPHHNHPVDAPPADYSDTLAVLCTHTGPVHGLSFSSQQPNFLSSGSAEGAIVVWDLAKPSSKAIETLQFCDDDDHVEISHLSWSPLLSKVIASASNFGTALWDVSAKSPLIRKLPWVAGCSHVEWSPRDKNLMAVAAGDLCDLPAVKVWDLRKMEHPVFQFCKKTRGVLGLSWCPFDSDCLVGCTNNNTVVALDVKKGEVIYEEHVDGRCSDICWIKSMEDHFAVSSSEQIDFYYRAPEI